MEETKSRNLEKEEEVIFLLYKFPEDAPSLIGLNDKYNHLLITKSGFIYLILPFLDITAEQFLKVRHHYNFGDPMPNYLEQIIILLDFGEQKLKSILTLIELSK
jgi:hypothetical protein